LGQGQHQATGLPLAVPPCMVPPMTTPFRFDPVELPPECEALRREVRGFIAEELRAGHWTPNSDFGSHRAADFSRRLGARGWIGTRATPVCGGYEVTGAKVWTSYAHESHYAITLVRTGPAPSSTPGADRHGGLSQLILDLKAPGVAIRPIRNLAGEHDFNEL